MLKFTKLFSVWALNYFTINIKKCINKHWQKKLTSQTFLCKSRKRISFTDCKKKEKKNSFSKVKEKCLTHQKYINVELTADIEFIRLKNIIPALNRFLYLMCCTCKVTACDRFLFRLILLLVENGIFFFLFCISSLYNNIQIYFIHFPCILFT